MNVYLTSQFTIWVPTTNFYCQIINFKNDAIEQLRRHLEFGWLFFDNGRCPYPNPNFFQPYGKSRAPQHEGFEFNSQEILHSF